MGQLTADRDRYALASPAYIAALAVLVVNDVWLKRMWPGLVTGKLSDVAGLYALAVFGCWLFRRPAAVCIAVAVAFIAWKLPLADVPIALWNDLVPALPLGRVADPTDLLALLVLPFAYHARETAGAWKSHLATTAIALCSLFAFVNTSIARHQFDVAPGDAVRRMDVAMPLPELVAALEKCGYRTSVITFPAADGSSKTDLQISYGTTLPDDTDRDIEATASIVTAEPFTTAELQQFEIFRQNSPGNEAFVKSDFMKRMRNCAGARFSAR